MIIWIWWRRFKWIIYCKVHRRPFKHKYIHNSTHTNRLKYGWTMWDKILQQKTWNWERAWIAYYQGQLEVETCLTVVRLSFALNWRLTSSALHVSLPMDSNAFTASICASELCKDGYIKLQLYSIVIISALANTWRKRKEEEEAKG